MTGGPSDRCAAWAPGRVNLIGDHTDHTGGLVLPMAVDLGTRVEGIRDGSTIELRSSWAGARCSIPIDVERPAAVEPAWARVVAGVVAEVRPVVGLTGDIATTLPVGAGLSSSAALEVAVALALGAPDDAIELARLCQRAEQRATGVPCGIMDQLASTAGVADAALRIDCTSLEVVPVPLPRDLEVLVVHCGQERALAASPYAERAAACQAAEAAIGTLRSATVDDAGSIADEVVRRRARHVITENRRVDVLADALRSCDRAVIGEVMAASHASLRDDFEVSTPLLDALVDELAATSGVIGARMTGAGFGGCVVALVEHGAVVELRNEQWRVRASAGAHLTR